MQFATISIFYTLAMLCIGAFAAPLGIRQETVSNVKCTGTTPLDFHTTNVALLQICGGIAGSVEKCQGRPTSTTGQSGNVRFTITPVNAGDQLNISKGRWEQGIKAAFAVCGQDIPFTATFAGGAVTGDVQVVYEEV